MNPKQPILSTFQCLEFQKNLMTRFREKFRSVDFGPKNDPFRHFLVFLGLQTNGQTYKAEFIKPSGRDAGPTLHQDT